MKPRLTCTTTEPAELHLRRSFVRHIPESEEIAQRVVDAFVRQGDPPRQVDTERLQPMIWATLATALDHLGDARAFRTSCRSVGKCYSALGLEAHDFGSFAHLLIDAMDLSEDERHAWRDFIARIGQAMITESGRTAHAPDPA